MAALRSTLEALNGRVEALHGGLGRVEAVLGQGPGQGEGHGNWLTASDLRDELMAFSALIQVMSSRPLPHTHTPALPGAPAFSFHVRRTHQGIVG